MAGAGAADSEPMSGDVRRFRAAAAGAGTAIDA